MPDALLPLALVLAAFAFVAFPLLVIELWRWLRR